MPETDTPSVEIPAEMKLRLQNAREKMEKPRADLAAFEARKERIYERKREIDKEIADTETKVHLGQAELSALSDLIDEKAELDSFTPAGLHRARVNIQSRLAAHSDEEQDAEKEIRDFIRGQLRNYHDELRRIVQVDLHAILKPMRDLGVAEKAGEHGIWEADRIRSSVQSGLSKPAPLPRPTIGTMLPDGRLVDIHSPEGRAEQDRLREASEAKLLAEKPRLAGRRIGVVRHAGV